jgi:hypothetical protein
MFKVRCMLEDTLVTAAALNGPCAFPHLGTELARVDGRLTVILRLASA